MTKPTITTASKSSPIITKSAFKGYDLCANSYVGCAFGCKYCYVRFFIKDKEKDWGEFVRRRDHIKTHLAKELDKPLRGKPIKALSKKTNKEISKPGKIEYDAGGNPIKAYEGKRLVIGTMTDPYQPVEREARLTRSMLNIILNHKTKLAKVGIFTRSPIIAEDIDIIQKLPKARVHFSISPYDDEIISKLEPIGVRHKRRFDTIKALKEAGIRIHVNVAPVIPIYSDDVVDMISSKLHELQVDEFFIDPVQPYPESFRHMKDALQSDSRWAEAEEIITNDEEYKKWKDEYHSKWKESWNAHNNTMAKPIWSDHEKHVWQDLISGKDLDPRFYDED